MKHSKRFCRWLLCTLLCLCLAGCSMPGEQVQVEELLRAPKLSGDYGDVQTALNDWLGESAQLKYPMQGELLSPFLLQDLDGDGLVERTANYVAPTPTPSPTPPEESEAPEIHTVNAIAGNGGSISPSGIVEVEDGGSVTFTITADPGYVLSELKVDGYTAELTDSFTFPNVTGEHTIYAIFREEVVETPPPTPTETPVETEDPFWPYITLPPEIDGDEFVTDQPAYPDNSFPSDFFPG